MIKANNEKQVMEAFISPAGQVIADFLRDCGEELLNKLIVAEGKEMYRTQGAVQELKEITDLASNARKVLHS